MRQEKIVKGIFYLIGALLSLIFGIVMGASFVSYQYYGGDAFTGIQHASAGTTESVNHGFMFLFLIMTVIFLGKGIGSLCGAKQSTETAKSISVE